MAKINYRQVEKMVDEGLRSYGVKQLLYFADLAGSYGSTYRDGNKPQKTDPFDDAEIRSISLVTLSENLKALHKRDKEVYKHFGITHKELQKYIDKPELLTPEEWEKIADIRNKIEKYRKELRSKLEKVSDEDIIASQRKRHVNKRFNVNERWLPLQ